MKQSKTDPLRQRVEGTTQFQVCPVEALNKYIGVRSPDPGPPFIFQSGAPLTRQALVSHLHEALEKVGIDHSRYNGHSFRTGAATTVAQHGLEDSLIQTLGRWKSSAYKLYIEIPRSQLAAVSLKLVQIVQTSPRAAEYANDRRYLVLFYGPDLEASTIPALVTSQVSLTWLCFCFLCNTVWLREFVFFLVLPLLLIIRHGTSWFSALWM